LPVARVVGSNGLVYAVDIEQRMLDMVRAKGAALNIVTVLSGGGAVPLPDQIADHALCAFLLHDPDDCPGRVRMAEDIGRLVRPRGIVLVIEWVPEEGNDRRRRLAPEETEAILREAVFEFDAASPLGEKQYVIVARRPAG